MKSIVIILGLIIFNLSNVNAKNNYYQQQDTTVVDSIAQEIVKEDVLIDEIIKAKSTPSTDRVQYFSQVTKYGFKNLFKKNTYNSSIPYRTQVNTNAKSFIHDYMRKNESGLIKMKSWGQPYFSLIQNIFMQYGLPPELKYIAVIESNLRVSETSNVGAAGPWQFMPVTAREFGLTVNGSYDERRDYYKSTHAAAKYLLTLYKQLHDWLLVMAAYNGGPGRVNSAIRKSGSRNFWDLQYYLPEESRTYVKKFIATHYIMEGGGGVTTMGYNETNEQTEKVAKNTVYNNEINNNNIYDNKPSLTSEENADVITETISGKFNSLIIAKNISMTIIQFNHFNPAFDAMMMNNGNYDLRLPADKMQLFIANKYPILNECVQLLLKDTDIYNNQTFYSSKKYKVAPHKKRK